MIRSGPMWWNKLTWKILQAAAFGINGRQNGLRWPSWFWKAYGRSFSHGLVYSSCNGSESSVLGLSLSPSLHSHAASCSPCLCSMTHIACVVSSYIRLCAPLILATSIPGEFTNPHNHPGRLLKFSFTYFFACFLPLPTKLWANISFSGAVMYP